MHWRKSGEGFEALSHEVNVLRMMLDECARAASGIYGHLVRNGVSVNIVFQVERDAHADRTRFAAARSVADRR